eukprot:CAMPEP_0172321906 /NCGR_PEP_ID=MMETSP1058-20130122/44609_1 /TAXON_ID=83371 /ORGANISM="Detonula confervacea, Strain CCMP 353" /LENGTH=393 /DNA_ID=CAMNT_0013037521 /DNA_START=93 /DNA_END=1274 /DNA_ORIENTATION=+
MSRENNRVPPQYYYCCGNKRFMFLISTLFLLGNTNIPSCSAFLIVQPQGFLEIHSHNKRASNNQCRSNFLKKHYPPRTRTSCSVSQQETMNLEESTIELEQEDQTTSTQSDVFRSRYWKDSTFLQNDILHRKYEEDIKHIQHEDGTIGINTNNKPTETTNNILEDSQTATTITCMHTNKHEHVNAVQLSSAITEQQAATTRTLASHIQSSKKLHNTQFEHRSFGDGKGGNDCTYLAPILQAWSPGIAQQVIHIVQQAYDAANWQELGYPSPSSLGIRTSEHLSYQGWKSLEGHKDVGSIYTCMIALKDPSDYGGGDFFVHNSLFDATDIQPERLSAVVFLSDTIHGVRPVTSGVRESFVTELWERDDSPLTLNRPTEEQWQEFLEGKVTPTLD